MKTTLTLLTLALAAAPASAHLMIKCDVIGPARARFVLTSEDNLTHTDFIPDAGRVTSAVEGYHSHGSGSTVRATIDAGRGVINCAPIFVGVYEPQWHFKTVCRPTFRYIQANDTCQTSCVDQPLIELGKIKAYPNPVRAHVFDAIHFEGFEADTGVKIYTMTGRVVYQKQAGPDGELHWHLDDQTGRGVPSGVYRVVAANGAAISVVVQR